MSGSASIRLRVVTVTGLVRANIHPAEAHEIARTVFSDLDDESRPMFRLRERRRDREVIAQELTIQWAGGAGDPDMDAFEAREKSLSEKTLLIEPGSVWDFELLAQPTVAKNFTREGAPLERGKPVAIADEPGQRRWIEQRFPGCSVTILELSSRRLTQPRGRSMLMVEARGEIVAHDPSSLARALTSGVGRGKSKGSGLLSVTQKKAK